MRNLEIFSSLTVRWFGALVLAFNAGLIVSGAAPLIAQDAAPDSALEKVVLQLRWDHQAQFAGYYAAVWQGFYADAGLDVKIRSAFGDEGFVQAVPEVLAGRAEFGIGAADVLVAIDGGAPLIIASPVFQQSGFGVVSRVYSGVASPADLMGLAVMRPTSDLAEAELGAMLAAEGVDPGAIRWVEGAPGLGAALLENRTVDAYFGFWPSSLWWLSELGLPAALLRPSAYGVYFYGDAIFTSARLAEQNPDLVSRFVEASLMGWKFALTHPNEIADRIAEDLETATPVPNSRMFNRTILRETNLTALRFPEIELGHSNPGRWSKMFEVLATAGLVNGQFEYLDFVFDPALREAQTHGAVLRVLARALVASLILAVIFSVWLRTLRRKVAARTSELADSEERYALAVAGTGSGIWDAAAPAPKSSKQTWCPSLCSSRKTLAINSLAAESSNRDRISSTTSRFNMVIL